jgi:serine/threonine-protein kinase
LQKEVARAVGERLGRYLLLARLGSGGMAAVYLARQSGPAGFVRRVAIKRLHPHLADDPAFATMFVDEVRLASCIRHPNVVSALDVLVEGGELALVMDYIEGGSLAQLQRAAREAGRTMPPALVARVAIDVLDGLQAAHEACDERGEPLGIVHRDVSPHNVMVGADGVARLVDFGVAKAAGRTQMTTENGQFKGKFAYVAPEQIERQVVGPRGDLYAVAVILWELLVGRRLFEGEGEAALFSRALHEGVVPPSKAAAVPPGFDAIALRGLAATPEERFEDARTMARAIERACTPAPAWQLSEWVTSLLGPELEARRQCVLEFEAELAASGAMDEGAAVGASSDQASLPGAATREPKGATTEMVLLTRSAVEARERPRRFVAWLAFAAAALLLGGYATHRAGVWGGAPELSAERGTAVAPQVPSVAGEAGAPAADEGAQARPSNGPLEPSALASAGTLSGEAGASGQTATQAKAPRTTAPRATARERAGGAKGAVDCDPPFTYDAAGIRHAKRECL